MRHASFFTGIGGFDLGFEAAGIATVSACEYDPFARRVYEARLGHEVLFHDGPRYRVLGNAVAVPVAAWLGRRLVEHGGSR